MLKRFLIDSSLKFWIRNSHLTPVYVSPIESLSKNARHYSNQGEDESKQSVPSTRREFQEELYEDSYCPPLATHIQRNLHPIKRTFDILGITGGKDEKSVSDLHFPHHCDIIIVGGGIMGCAIAYSLKAKGHDNGLRIVVVERDPTYTRASTVLSVGGLRQQFSLPENIQMSLYGAEFLRKSQKLLSGENLEAPDVQFHPYGYVFLASEQGAQQLQENHKLQT